MATTPRTPAEREVDYPTSDGRPMAETDLHRQDMMDVILVLQERFAAFVRIDPERDFSQFYGPLSEPPRVVCKIDHSPSLTARDGRKFSALHYGKPRQWHLSG